jgi:hypothetical protein
LKAIFCTDHGYDAADILALAARAACTAPVANMALSLILNTYRYFTFVKHCI